MPNHEADQDTKILPKPVTLTSEEIQQIAAGTATALPVGVDPPILTGVQTPE